MTWKHSGKLIINSDKIMAESTHGGLRLFKNGCTKNKKQTHIMWYSIDKITRKKYLFSKLNYKWTHYEYTANRKTADYRLHVAGVLLHFTLKSKIWTADPGVYYIVSVLFSSNSITFTPVRLLIIRNIVVLIQFYM